MAKATKFTNEFIKTFEASSTMYNSAISKVKNILSKDIKCEYGICNKYYKFRYITTEDMIDFTSDVFDAISNNLLAINVADMDIFSVKYISAILNRNNCPPIADTDSLGLDYMFNEQKDLDINSMTLQSLLYACENEIENTEVISRSDMKQRCDSIKEKVDLIAKDDLIKSVRKIIMNFDNIAKESSAYNDHLKMDLIKCSVEKFITFAVCLNMISLYNLTAYAIPFESWTTHEVRCDDFGVPVKNPANYRNNDTIHRYWKHEMTKTSMLSINEKMCNFNVKTTVLTDLTDSFKDTICMIDFIIRDTRSPFYMDIVKNIPRGYTHKMAVSSCDPVINMLFGGIKGPGVDTIIDLTPSVIAFPNGSSSIMSYKKKMDTLSSTDAGWLDKLTYGDSFDFGNRRLDTMVPRTQPKESGRCKLEIIIQSIWEMYKPKSETSEDTAKSILSVATLMKCIIAAYVSHMNDTRTTISRENVVDILAELGEILTRQLLNLYRKCRSNTVHVCGDYESNDNEFVNPFMEEMLEEFSIENDTFITEDVTVSSNKPKSFFAENVDSWFQKFLQWITDMVGRFGEKFNEDHKKEVEWINKNKDTINKIGNAIGDGNQQFKVNISNYYLYKIPAKDILTSCDYDAKVTEWINKINTPNQDNGVSMEEIKRGIFPNPADDNSGFEVAVKETDNGKLRAYLTNFFLFGKYDIKDEDKISKSSTMNKEMFDDLVSNVRDTGPTLQRISREMSNKLKTSLTKVQQAYNEAKKEKEETKTESVDIEINDNFYTEDVNPVGKKSDFKAPDSSAGKFTAEGNNNAEGNKSQSEGSNKDTTVQTGDKDAANTKKPTENGTPENSKAERLKTLLSNLRDISNIYHVTCLNVIRSKFYKNSYNTFRAVVKGYVNWEGKDKSVDDKATKELTGENEKPAEQNTAAGENTAAPEQANPTSGETAPK